MGLLQRTSFVLEGGLGYFITRVLLSILSNLLLAGFITDSFIAFFCLGRLRFFAWADCVFLPGQIAFFCLGRLK